MRRFTSKDIGAELLPILTSGLYRDPFDAVREYTQNGIDAGASLIKIIVASNSVTILDNGHGMTPEVADRAIRLGISDKDPRSQVGFRGIGIYSALHLCDQLVVRTRDKDDRASIIRIDFALIRNLISEQEESRLKGDRPTLWLEGVMEQAVRVGDDPDCPLVQPGTSVFMRSLSTDMGDRLKDREKLEVYLQNVVPLPFSPDFRWRELIEANLQLKQYKSVAIDLVHGGVSRSLHRPYTDRAFTYAIGEAPKFLDVIDQRNGTSFGHCWYCANDDNHLLPEKSLRGLLIKKFGFSVGGRSYAHRFFGRKIISDRITGELIVDFTDLLPNAARDDFEAGPYRDSFSEALMKVARDITEHVDTLQNERKAQDLLGKAIAAGRQVFEDLPSASGDVQSLLQLNVLLATHVKNVEVYRKLLKKLVPGQLVEFDHMHKTLEMQIAGLIRTKKTKRPARVAQILEGIDKGSALPEREESAMTEAPASLLEVADQLGLAVAPQMQKFISATDEQMVIPNMTEDDYKSALADLQTSLEEQL